MSYACKIIERKPGISRTAGLLVLILAFGIVGCRREMSPSEVMAEFSLGIRYIDTDRMKKVSTENYISSEPFIFSFIDNMSEADRERCFESIENLESPEPTRRELAKQYEYSIENDEALVRFKGLDFIFVVMVRVNGQWKIDRNPDYPGASLDPENEEFLESLMEQID